MCFAVRLQVIGLLRIMRFFSKINLTNLEPKYAVLLL